MVFSSDPFGGGKQLSWAAQYRYHDVVKILLEQRSNITDHTPHRWKGEVESLLGRPLHLAAANGHNIIVQLLLDEGASVGTSLSGETPLLTAARNGHDGVVKLLLDRGADTEDTDSFGETPLSLATENGHAGVVKVLLEQGANVEHDVSGETPIEIAVRNGHESIVELLITNLADIRCRNRHGKTLLISAASKGHKSIVKLLLDSGGDTLIEEKYGGHTALAWAAKNGHTSTAKLLLVYGADYRNATEEPETWNRVTAIREAAREGHDDVVRLLLSYKMNAVGSGGERSIMVDSGEQQQKPVAVTHAIAINKSKQTGYERLFQQGDGGYLSPRESNSVDRFMETALRKEKEKAAMDR
ncbi:ankyrin repeat-containing domain protein [Podospora australis]|uniref:Ankyrin repeat-containing domain protein n=1 Tax=Podospora australis TaxID=1536484 RepID=A0AAN6WHN4_9PEZI|nr:ankyrin repeat-containing domain protein [Podospora australis]